MSANRPCYEQPVNPTGILDSFGTACDPATRDGPGCQPKRPVT